MPKCHNCSLANFEGSTACRRCGAALGASALGNDDQGPPEPKRPSAWEAAAAYREERPGWGERSAWGVVFALIMLAGVSAGVYRHWAIVSTSLGLQFLESAPKPDDPGPDPSVGGKGVPPCITSYLDRRYSGPRNSVPKARRENKTKYDVEVLSCSPPSRTQHRGKEVWVSFVRVRVSCQIEVWTPSVQSRGTAWEEEYPAAAVIRDQQVSHWLRASHFMAERDGPWPEKPIDPALADAERGPLPEFDPYTGEVPVAREHYEKTYKKDSTQRHDPHRETRWGIVRPIRFEGKNAWFVSFTIGSPRIEKETFFVIRHRQVIEALSPQEFADRVRRYDPSSPSLGRILGTPGSRFYELPMELVFAEPSVQPGEHEIGRLTNHNRISNLRIYDDGSGAESLVFDMVAPSSILPNSGSWSIRFESEDLASAGFSHLEFERSYDTSPTTAEVRYTVYAELPRFWSRYNKLKIY